MARKKLTEEEKQVQSEIKNQKQKEEQLKFELSQIEEQYINEPTIFYNVGEKVIYGNHPHAEIVEVHKGGKFYKVKTWGLYKEYTTEVYKENIFYLSWTDIEKFRTKEDNDKIEIFTQKDELRLNYSQSSIRDIFGKVYYFGLDMNPEYQRGNVWDLEDKRNLINSIFNNVDIGKFVYVYLPYKKNMPGYEILDGKQRIATIVEFFENRFSFKNKAYSELSWKDKSHFKNYPISIAKIENATKRQKLLYFLKLNTGGRLVDHKHLEYVQSLYDEEVKHILNVQKFI